ncbi:DNA replication and repair protein RecO [Blastomonas natatoria]|uniref:DNA repair protein RecO n=1 Tax=Blastomonas natatoria TaxID=34015 RepID=A0A2V3VA06_9SPHN|nr:DNA repair protein RecO [Blastomonas natatoria]PXW78613.1 DNA replication and repair protein RecO [Blastomonas natatoria]
MPVIRTPGIVCTVRRHGEHGAVVRLLTPDHGLQSGYVRGGRSTALRPVLMPANLVTAELRSRVNDQLAGLTVELAESRAPFYSEPLVAAAFEWVTLLTATVAPEDQPFSRLYAALAALLDLVCAAPSARWWLRAMVRYEALLLAELGFGLDLERCAVTGGREDLTYVSPRTGRAVSLHAAGVYAEKLLVLPAFMTDDEEPDWEQLMQGFALTGHFIERQFFSDRRADALAARAMLIDRVRRMVG